MPTTTHPVLLIERPSQQHRCSCTIMTRKSRDQLDLNGYIWNGYDYLLQVWVQEGNVLPCAHPLKMRANPSCCEANRLAGLPVKDIPGAERIHLSHRQHRRFILS